MSSRHLLWALRPRRGKGVPPRALPCLRRGGAGRGEAGRGWSLGAELDMQIRNDEPDSLEGQRQSRWRQGLNFEQENKEVTAGETKEKRRSKGVGGDARRAKDTLNAPRLQDRQQ